MKQKLFLFAFLFFLIWMSRFLLSNSFGLYEDDWHFSGIAITNTLTQNLSRVNSALSSFWQGRPLHMIFLTFIPFWGSRLGGLNTLYFIGFVILGINACLWYSLLRDLTDKPHIPLFATLFFCLYPADTTFNFLQHLFGIQTSLLFLLIAFHFYIRSEKFLDYTKIVSYIFAILSLLTYESPFLTFFVAPLLQNKKSKIRFFQHICLLTLILVVYLILRKLFGEDRVAVVSTNLASALSSLIYQLVSGPIISLSTYFIRPLQVIARHEFKDFLIEFFSLPIFYIMINYFLKSLNDKPINKNAIKNIDLLKAGIFSLFLSYFSAITLSVISIDGRSSRVHFAAILGTTIILSYLYSVLIIRKETQNWLKRGIIFLLSLHLSLLLAFHINVQEFYKLSWDYQKAFWSDVLHLSPDIEENTVILVQAPNLKRWGKYINPFDWSIPSVLSAIYQFPTDWKYQPSLYLLNSTLEKPDEWKNQTIQNDTKFVLSNDNQGISFYYPWNPKRTIDATHIILLTEEDGQLVRQNFTTLPNGKVISLKLKPKTLQLPDYSKSPLYDKLILDVPDTEKKPRIYFQFQN